ncbi:MAG: glutathione S-transferase C-terminal domain-containing protein, partial [Thermoplasmata archaeon]|nr:glutathione S-transferase C-terminal domain-containing protein [Thermoplasmata archaeon]
VLEEKIWRAVLTEVPPILGDDRERWVFEEMQTRARGPWHVLVQRRAEFEAEAVETLAMVDRILVDRAWILGEPSLADFGIFGSLSPWLTVGRRIPPELPHLARWVERIRSMGPGTPPPRARAAKAGARRAR